MGVNIIAALWGFAEATLFFIVPDVWLSLAGRRDLKKGLAACLYSIAGALFGGALIYMWGVKDMAGATALIEKVPAISPEMVSRVHDELSSLGVWSIFIGPFKGTPYKLYAAQAADAGVGIILFLLTTIPARGFRFALMTLGAHYGLRAMKRWKIANRPVAVILVCWAINYALFFTLMPW